MTELISLDDVIESDIERFICYPKYDEKIVKRRLQELKELGVEKLALEGPHVIQGLNVLGKGHVGIVLLALREMKKVALKIKRTDADREDMSHEAKVLTLANSVGVGPHLLDHSKNFIVMELIEGTYLGEWIKENNPNPDSLRKVLRDILMKTYKLDSIRLDHGELTRVKRHFIITDHGPRIIDFESASLNRRSHNVNTTIQSFFMNYGFNRLIENILPSPDKNVLVNALKRYKQDPIYENFMKIIEVIGI